MGNGCLLLLVSKTRRRRYSTASEANEWVLKELFSLLAFSVVLLIVCANSRALYSRVTGEPLSLRVGSGTGSIRAFKFTNTRDGAGLGYIVLCPFFISSPPHFSLFIDSLFFYPLFLTIFYQYSRPPLFFRRFLTIFSSINSTLQIRAQKCQKWGYPENAKKCKK